MIKEAYIGDASKSSLSSYAYILMLIHYLQKVRVLPVLQELHESDECPVLETDGWNTWFQNDPDAIKRNFTCLNHSTTSRLWVGFLEYYSYDFNFKNAIVQIRQARPVENKTWDEKCMYIEDPFELSHNLARGVTSQMAEHIVHVFKPGFEIVNPHRLN